MSGLYRGIDAEYYGNDGALEYDLIVKPGADPAQIRFRFAGQRVRLDSDGNLNGAFLQKPPTAYQMSANGTRTPIESHYHRNSDGSFGFTLGPYDRTKTLVIDPVFTFSAYLVTPTVCAN